MNDFSTDESIHWFGNKSKHVFTFLLHKCDPTTISDLWILSTIFLSFVLFVLSSVKASYQTNKRMITNNSTMSIIQHQHHYHCHSIESINEPTAITDILPKNYDYTGAALFIIVVLLWYSIGLICMLGMQIRAREDTIEDCARRRAKLLIQTLRDQTQRKEILEELVDRQKREKLWNIYLGKIDTNKEELKRADVLRIKNIEKQLAAINRNQMMLNESVISPVKNPFIRETSSDSRSTLISNLPSVEHQVRHRRRSSFDQQILERWKSIVDQSKTMEQLPWSIRKIQIRRHFRRFYKNSSKQSQERNALANDSPRNREPFEVIDDEQCHLLPTENRARPLTRKSNERLNPYITYFHLPIDEHPQNIAQNLPLVTIKSVQHSIQIDDDDDECQC